MKIALIIPIFNRPQYVQQCFASLSSLTLKPDLLILVDDASTEQLPFCPLPHKLIKHEKNTGIRSALTTGIEYAFKQKATVVINLDSDAIVKPDFIERLIAIHQPNDYIATGFNAKHKDNPITQNNSFETFGYKPFANGINMCFNKQQYERYIKPSLAKTGNWDYNTSLLCQRDNKPFVTTLPSVVQHIGMQSSMGHVGADVAYDFNRIHLPNVTLFGIDSHDVAGIARAAEISQRNVQFGAVNIITADRFTKGGNSDVRRRDYSRFMLKQLAGEFSTSHVLTIHADGYVMNPAAWRNEWLQYDYIGAPWDWYKENNVGNGGFSLRSKKLCDILATQDIDESLMHPEDHHICRTFRRSLEEDFGIKFAPIEVAKQFSREGYGLPHELNLYDGEFGFHSYHVNWRNYLLYGITDDMLPQPPQKNVSVNRQRLPTFARR